MNRQSLLTNNNLAIIASAFFILLTGNFALFSRLTTIYPINDGNLLFVISLFSFFALTTILLLISICHGKMTRWVVAFILLLSAQAGYFMDSYGVIIDDLMIDNIFHSDIKEINGLLSFGFFARTLFLGLIPAFLAFKYWPQTLSVWSEIKSKIIIIVSSLILLILTVSPFTEDYSDFIREHKIVRFYANPNYFIYSSFIYLHDKFKSAPSLIVKKIAQDAKPTELSKKKELIILVVGETARADRFSLNGYNKTTNPMLKKQSVISFDHVSSCGTSTGISVPCMFSSMQRKDFDNAKALQFENVLDVLSDNGVKVLWRDNNSDSKGVALRVPYEDFKTPAMNPVCDTECRDVGMLAGLDQFIQKNSNNDMLIVLHQMGNHGPEYYRRYPKEFERFKPVCKSSRLSNCSKSEVDNAYDNAILYTDYFLSNTIDFLKKYDNKFETAMLYISDHGESLGENGFYLHAAPYAIAPKEQTHVPAILWLGENFEMKLSQLEQFKSYPFEHSDLFCVLLGAYELNVKMCDASKKSLPMPADD
jgi:lipid A ethanolaminephosphotransferase